MINFSRFCLKDTGHLMKMFFFFTFKELLL